MAKSDYEIQDPSTGQWTPYTGSGSGNIRSGGTTYSNYAGQQAYSNEADPAAAPDPATTNPIPTNPDGSQVGGGTPWDAGSSAPSSAPPGYHWDAGMAMFQPDASPPTGPMVSTPGPPPGPLETTGATGGTGGSGAGASGAGAAGPVIPYAQPSGGAQSSGGTTGGGASSGSQTPPSVSQPVDPADAAYKQSIRDALLKAINAPGVDMNDPDIAPAIQANRVSQERMLQQQRDAIAERLNAQGLAGSGALDQQMAHAFEQTGMNEGNFAGNAVLQQALARRQQLVALLGTGANLLSAEEARQAQLKIADLDAFLRQQSITNQNNQANDSMGMTAAYYRALLQEQANRDYLGA